MIMSNVLSRVAAVLEVISERDKNGLVVTADAQTEAALLEILERFCSRSRVAPGDRGRSRHLERGVVRQRQLAAPLAFAVYFAGPDARAEMRRAAIGSANASPSA
jgi:hypothetical protein